jgi:hypothetical protein
MTNLDEMLNLLHHEDRTSSRPLDDVRARVLEAASTNVVPLRRRRFMPVTVAAAAAALVATGVLAVKANDAPSQAPPAAADSTVRPEVRLVSAAGALEDAASKIKTVDQPLAPGQYRLITEHGTYARGMIVGPSTDKGGTWAVELTSKTWIPADVTKEWLNRRTKDGEVKWLGGNVPQSEVPFRLDDTDTGERRGACGDFFPNARPKKVCGSTTDWDSPAFYASLPRDPAALYDWLRSSTSQRGSAPVSMFTLATEILRAGQMPADLRAAWYRAIAKIDGVVLTSEKVTVDGRTGVGITMMDKRERLELVISPETGDFIGERNVAGPEHSNPWIPEGTVLKAVSITTTVVDSIG